MTSDQVIEVVLAGFGGLLSLLGALVAFIFYSLKQEVIVLRKSVEELNKNVAIVVAKVQEHDKEFDRTYKRLERLERKGL